jgi:hypothetical protein
VLYIEKRDMRFCLAVPYREREQVRAVVDALGGYPAGRHRSLFFLWALLPLLNVIAWLHAAIVTRRIRYLAFAIVYLVPVVIGEMIQSAHPSAGGGWFAIPWLVCLGHVVGARTHVAEEAWIHNGQLRSAEHPDPGYAGDGHVRRHQNFEDTVADNLPAGERLIASVRRVSLDPGLRGEHGLYSGGFPQDAVAVTDRRVLATRLKRRRFKIVESSLRTDARVTKYEPKRHDGESRHDHIVIQASDRTVGFGVALTMHDRGSELIAALGGVLEPARVTCGCELEVRPTSKRAATKRDSVEHLAGPAPTPGGAT